MKIQLSILAVFVTVNCFSSPKSHDFSIEELLSTSVGIQGETPEAYLEGLLANELDEDRINEILTTELNDELPDSEDEKRFNSEREELLQTDVSYLGGTTGGACCQPGTPAKGIQAIYDRTVILEVRRRRWLQDWESGFNPPADNVYFPMKSFSNHPSCGSGLSNGIARTSLHRADTNWGGSLELEVSRNSCCFWKKLLKDVLGCAIPLIVVVVTGGAASFLTSVLKMIVQCLVDLYDCSNGLSLDATALENVAACIACSFCTIIFPGELCCDIIQCAVGDSLETGNANSDVELPSLMSELEHLNKNTRELTNLELGKTNSCDLAKCVTDGPCKTVLDAVSRLGRGSSSLQAGSLCSQAGDASSLLGLVNKIWQCFTCLLKAMGKIVPVPGGPANPINQIADCIVAIVDAALGACCLADMSCCAKFGNASSPCSGKRIRNGCVDTPIPPKVPNDPECKHRRPSNRPNLYTKCLKECDRCGFPLSGGVHNYSDCCRHACDCMCTRGELVSPRQFRLCHRAIDQCKHKADADPPILHPSGCQTRTDDCLWPIYGPAH